MAANESHQATTQRRVIFDDADGGRIFGRDVDVPGHSRATTRCAFSFARTRFTRSSPKVVVRIPCAAGQLSRGCCGSFDYDQGPICRPYRVLPASSYGSVDDVAMGGAIVRSLDETLGSKGYRQEASRPDFVVKWYVSVGSRPQPTTMDTPTFRDVRPMPWAGSPSVPVMVTRQ